MNSSSFFEFDSVDVFRFCNICKNFKQGYLFDIYNCIVLGKKMARLGSHLKEEVRKT